VPLAPGDVEPEGEEAEVGVEHRREAHGSAHTISKPLMTLTPSLPLRAAYWASEVIVGAVEAYQDTQVMATSTRMK
jgi:hypothetical protein